MSLLSSNNKCIHIHIIMYTYIIYIHGNILYIYTFMRIFCANTDIYTYIPYGPSRAFSRSKCDWGILGYIHMHTRVDIDTDNDWETHMAYIYIHSYITRDERTFSKFRIRMQSFWTDHCLTLRTISLHNIT